MRLLAGDADGIVRIECPRAAPGIRDDADVVAELICDGVLEPAQPVEDEQYRARTDADQVDARSDACIEPARSRARTARDAGAVCPVPDVRIGVRYVLDEDQRCESGQRAGVGNHLHVLDDVLRVMGVGMGAVDSGVVDHQREVSFAADRKPTVGADEVGIGPHLVHARQHARLIVQVMELVVEPDRAHGSICGQRAHLSGGSRGPDHSKVLERVTTADPGGLQHRQMRSVQTGRRVEGHNDRSYVRRVGKSRQSCA